MWIKHITQDCEESHILLHMYIDYAEAEHLYFLSIYDAMVNVTCM